MQGSCAQHRAAKSRAKTGSMLVARGQMVSTTRMTKAERIRQYAKAHPKATSGMIAKACDCLSAYVRVVLRQRPGGSGRSEGDLRYYVKNRAKIQERVNKYRSRRLRTDPAYRERENARWRRAYAANPEHYREIKRRSRWRRKMEADARLVRDVAHLTNFH